MKPANAQTHSKKNAASQTKFANHTPTMTEQLIAPPARVWEKIERILDEQDSQRSSGIALPSSNPKHKSRVPIFAAAASVIAGFIWLTK